ncbi:MAG: right-handed parallel beta-helix repeat-containing protein, partial [Myxococcota bacterium]
MRTTLAFVGALTLTGIADNAGGATTKGCRAPEEAPPPANCPPLPQTARCGGYRCFFISPCHGDDRTGDGSLRRPWKSFRWLTHAGDESQPRAMELRAGDVVQVVDGTIDQSFGAGDGTRALFTAHRVRGRADAPITFKAFSGRTPVLDPGRDGVGLRLLQTSHVVVEGLSVRNACGHGISIEKSQSVTLRNVRVSATDGLDRVEVAGVHVSSSRDVRIDGGQFFDNFDRDAVDTDGEATDNSGNVVFVGGRNASVRNAHLFNTLGNDRSGYCLKYKRASKDPAATFEVVGNRFDNCSFFAVSSGTQNTLVSDNLIVG